MAKSVLAADLSMDDAIGRLRDEQRPSRSDLASVANDPSRSWDLNTNFNTARTLAEFGWKEKGQELERYLSIVQELTREGWHSHLDVGGECVDIGAYLEGEPECMMNFDVPVTRSVRIIANISARCSADAERLLNRGIAIAAAVYTLQANGMGVALSVGDWVSEYNAGGDLHQTTVEVNPFGDYIDPGRLAFWLGHPAALRRCMFRYNEQESPAVRSTFGFHSGGGYGYPADPDVNAITADGTIFIPFPETSSLHLYATPQQAFDTVRKILEQQGITLERGR